MNEAVNGRIPLCASLAQSIKKNLRALLILKVFVRRNLVLLNFLVIAILVQVITSGMSVEYDSLRI